MLAPPELRARRLALGLTQAALADLLEVSANTLARWERGELHVGDPRRIARRLQRLEKLHRMQSPPPQAAPALCGPAPHAAVDAASPVLDADRQILPDELTSFVGREAELLELHRLVASARLVTLTGAGGVGKTRLALELLRDVRADTEAMLVWTDLSPLSDPRLVPQTVAVAFAIREQPGRPLLATLIDAIHGKHVLLVLDNCEHLVHACASLVDALLRRCPNLRILVTSRERLGINGETIWRVPSLELPEAELSAGHIEGTAAVRLFIDRTRAVLPVLRLHEHDMRVIADICRRLDGIPLAIELAATQVSVLSLDQIAFRLDHALALLTGGSRIAADRQQTVRATLDWSYQLLSASEQLLLDRLAVFAGGWTLDAAEEIASVGDLASVAGLPTLSLLVDKSLVQVERHTDGSVRYRLLETVRQYALERLELRGEMACMRDRHAVHFVRLVERSEGALTGHGHLDAQARLDREQDNCRAALQWLLDRKDAEPARRMAGGLGRFWFFRGYLAEGEGWFERVLALPDTGQPTIGRARCIYGLGRLALSRADYARVVEKIEAARELYRELGDTAEEGWALFCLGFVARARGDYPRARALLDQGLDASRASRNGTAEANCLWSLAEVAYDLGDDRQARVWAEAGLARATEVGWLIGVTVSRRILGAVHIRQGDFAAASEVLYASLAEARAVGARWWIAETLAQLAQLALEQGKSRQAGRSLFESLNVARDLGDLAGITRGLEVAASLAVVQQAPRPALQLAGAAARLRETMLAPKPPADRAPFERRLAVARRCLRRSLAEADYADGSTLPLQHSIELALARARIARDGTAPQQATIRLTPREVAVSRLIAQGLSNRQIAQHLVIAEGTAERHVGNILEKLEMTSRAQIAAWAVGAGLVQPSSQPRWSSQRDYMPQM